VTFSFFDEIETAKVLQRARPQSFGISTMAQFVPDFLEGPTALLL
jgi:hypothetical protein